MKYKIVFLFTIIAVLFTGCSWQEYFIISNTSSSSINIDYKLKDSTKGFDIFDQIPTAYTLTASGTIDWENPLTILDTDTTLLSVKLVIPANSSVIIGHLSNDHYTGYNQYFINSRNFNLKQIRIINHEKVIEIIPQTFDTFFKKDMGEIVFKMH